MCKVVGESCDGGVWSKTKLGVMDAKADDVKKIKEGNDSNKKTLRLVLGMI
jgi:hypothetical protein